MFEPVQSRVSFPKLEQDILEFWREHRLGFQLRLARESGLTDATFDRLVKLPTRLAKTEFGTVKHKVSILQRCKRPTDGT